MATNLETSEIGDNHLWDAFVAGSPQGNVFSTSTWMEAAAGAQGGTPRMYGVFEDGRLLAGVSFIEVVRGPFRKATIPILTLFGGFVYNIDPETVQSDTESLQLLCAEKLICRLQKQYHHVLLVHAPRFNDIRPFIWQGWNNKVQYTYLLNIQDSERLWSTFKERARRKIRKAAESLKIGDPVSPDNIGVLFEHIFRKRDRTPPVPRAMVTAMVERLVNSGLIEINTAVDGDGAVVALQVLVIDTDTIYAWIYGTVSEKDHTDADSFLIWNAAERYSKTHCRFDLMGANIPSIAFFKKGFGGTLAPYYVTEWYASPLVRAAFSLYTRMHKVLP